MIITRKFEFDAAHRILGHESKCKHLHGHRYVAEVSVQAPTLDELGRVVDFSCLKGVVGNWINEHWDHNILLRWDDPLVALLTRISIPDRDHILGGKMPFLFFKEYGNPTAENIARYLFNEVDNLLENYHDIKPVKVVVFETPNCSAEYTPSLK